MLNDQKRFTPEDRYGLQEVEDMNELITRLDRIGEKEWFRLQMGMSKGGYLSIIYIG